LRSTLMGALSEVVRSIMFFSLLASAMVTVVCVCCGFTEYEKRGKLVRMRVESALARWMDELVIVGLWEEDEGEGKGALYGWRSVWTM
jgi:CDP-diglyceride synthetase